MSHTNRFPHNEREKLQFEDGGISSDRLAGSLLKMGTPVHVLDSQPVSELSRSMYSLVLQPERDPFPSVFVSDKRLPGLAMSHQEFRDPGVPRSAVDDRHSLIFLCLQLGAEDFRFYGVVRIVGPKPGGFVVLFSVGIDILDVPER